MPSDDKTENGEEKGFVKQFAFCWPVWKFARSSVTALPVPTVSFCDTKYLKLLIFE